MGIEGFTGPEGVRGLKGERGVTGPTGAAGMKGDKVSSFMLLGFLYIFKDNPVLSAVVAILHFAVSFGHNQGNE